MKLIKSIHRISIMYMRVCLEFLLWSTGLSGIYICKGLASDSGRIIAETIEKSKTCLEYTAVSFMLIVGTGLFLDYVFKYENIL